MSTKKVYSLADFSTSKPKQKEETSAPRKQETGSKQKASPGCINIDLDGIPDFGQVDKHIQKLYDDCYDALSEAEGELRDLLKQTPEGVEELVLAEMQRDYLMTEISKLREKLGSFDEYFEYAEYLLEKYQSIAPVASKRVVGSADMSIPQENYADFQIIISEFLNLAMRFTEDIKIVTQHVNARNCKCGASVDINVNSCPECGKDFHSKEAINFVGETHKEDYYRSETFEDYFDECQGRRKKPIPPEIYQKITEHCKRQHVKESELTKADILRILKKYKLSDYYKSINLISNVLIGTPLPEIEEYRQRCIRRHALIEKEYMELRETEKRNNFLYAWFVLQVCLILEGYDAKEEYFVSLTTADAAKNHNRFMIKICDRIREKQKTDPTIVGNWLFTGIR